MRGLSILAMLLLAFTLHAEEPPRTPADIIKSAPVSDWRAVDPANAVYLELATGQVIIELFPDIAPRHAENFRQLVRDGFYNGLSIYRVVEGFVAQGGDPEGSRGTGEAARRLPAEFVRLGELPYSFQPVNFNDGYAAVAGFMHGFPVGREHALQWLLHCPGSVGMARQDKPGSGGTEFYVVLGHAPRYLDRNATVFGVVRSGMEHLQKLNRGKGASGQLSAERRNPISRARLGADIPAAERMPLQVMLTDSDSFRELVRSRASRPEAWFVYQPGFVDVCGVPVPVRQGAAGG